MRSTPSVQIGAMRMRGTDVQQGGLFSHVSLQERVPADHPLRAVGGILDEALSSMSRDFDRVDADGKHWRRTGSGIPAEIRP